MRGNDLTPYEEHQLQQWADNESNPRLSLRAYIILMACKEKKPISLIAQKLSIHRNTVKLWDERFLEDRLEALTRDAPRVGRMPKETTPSPEEIRDIIRNEKPEDGSDWTHVSLAIRLKTSESTIRRLCKTHKIPMTKDDLEMKQYLEQDHPVSNIGGGFVDPVIQAMAFHLDCVDRNPLMVNDCPDNAPNPRIVEAFAIKYREFESEMTRLMLKTEGRKNRRSDLDFLCCLDKLKRYNPGGKDIMLVMSSIAADARDRISRYINQHPQFHLSTWVTPDAWLSQVRGVIDSVEDRYKRVMFHELENMLADYAMYDIETRRAIRPFVSVIKHRR